MATQLSRLVQLHKAIAHPVRLRLLALLRGGPLCVCQMTVVTKLAASTVSEHLSDLRKAGLVAERKQGRWVEYRLAAAEMSGHILKPVWLMLEGDQDVAADALLVKELRRIPLDELCGVDLDLSRLNRPKLASAVAKAEAMRRCCE
jgi:DNA-binding transcriptional ArsR family regulator